MSDWELFERKMLACQRRAAIALVMSGIMVVGFIVFLAAVFSAVMEGK